MTEAMKTENLLIWSFRRKKDAAEAQVRMQCLLDSKDIRGFVWFYKISELSLHEKYHLACYLSEMVDDSHEIKEFLAALSSPGHFLENNKRTFYHLVTYYTQAQKHVEQYNITRFGHADVSLEETEARLHAEGIALGKSLVSLAEMKDILASFHKSIR